MATVTDVYIVNVPTDLGDYEERVQVAIHQAREEISRVYAIPCEWFTPGEDEIVVLRHRNPGKFPEPEVRNG